MLTSLIPLLLVGCQADGPDVEISRLTSHGNGVAGVTVTLRSGDDDVDINVETRSGDDDWEAAVATETGGDRLEVALVADNSGSEEGFLDPMQAAVDDFGAAIMGTHEASAVGLVRVTTEAQVMLDLTDDLSVWESAVGDLFIGNGWTALWDGVRVANEVLEDGAQITTAGGLEVCLGQASRSVVVFTDGQENNSADEHDTSFSGDGIDTTLGDLVVLTVHGVQTPVHAIGIGRDVDEDQLTLLGEGSGGSFRAIDDITELSDALAETVADLTGEIPVCFEAASCEHDEARITVDDGTDSYELTFELPGLCGCTRTQGYWKNHEEEWPLDSLDLGGVNYSAETCDELLGTSVRSDVSISMAYQLIAAKLNVASGASDADIADSIAAADDWLAAHDDGDGLPFDVMDWDGGEEIKDALDAWNNGVTGPGHCD